jgi:hypothetical protein
MDGRDSPFDPCVQTASLRICLPAIVIFTPVLWPRPSQESMRKTSLSQESHLNLWAVCRNLIGEIPSHSIKRYFFIVENQ